MSDEPASSATRGDTSSDNGTADSHRQSSHASARNAAVERRQRNRRLFNKKREAFLADLMRDVDILVYAELSAVYYMEYVWPSFRSKEYIG